SPRNGGHRHLPEQEGPRSGKDQPMNGGAMAGPAIVRVHGVHKYFTRGGEQIDVLNNLHLEVAQGEYLGLMGPSGSGKTTLLNLIAGLDKPSEGEVWIGEALVSRMTESE